MGVEYYLIEHSASISLESKVFPNGGFYVMRHKDLYMIVDCVPNNPKAPSGHRHNSRLSFELFAYDKTFIVDPGTYTYTTDPEWRNKFRSTAYHNTVVVDGEEQNDFDPYYLFQVGMNAEVKVNEWKVTDEYDFLDAQHSGYERLAEPITHRRQIWFNKRDGYWVIKDMLLKNSKFEEQGLQSNVEHRFELYFHFAPMAIAQVGATAIKTDCNGLNLMIMQMEDSELNLSLLDGWISYSYGTKEKATIAKYSKISSLPATFTTALYPYEQFSDDMMEVLKDRVMRISNEHFTCY